MFEDMLKVCLGQAAIFRNLSLQKVLFSQVILFL